MRRRALIALAVLVGFYATAASIVLVLLATPLYVLVLTFERGGSVNVTGFAVLFVGTWLPAFLIAKGFLKARPPRFREPGPRLKRRDAPALFVRMRRRISVPSTQRRPSPKTRPSRASSTPCR